MEADLIDGERGATPRMASPGTEGSTGDDREPARDGRGRPVPAGSVHAVGAGGDGAPLGGGAARGGGAAVPGGREADGRVDDDRDAGGALAAPRRGWLPAGAGSPEALD